MKVEMKRIVLLINLFLRRKALPKEKGSQKTKVIAILAFAFVMLAIAMMISPAAAEAGVFIEGTKIKRGIGYAFLGLAFVLVIISLVIVVKRKREERRGEERG
jgi:hydrogenase-4 membrane subunit HyfE